MRTMTLFQKIFFFLGFLKCCPALRILEFVGPAPVVNGSKSLIILDCPYILENKDEENGLEVKWFYNKVQFPIYQWIPGNQPQDLIFFKGRLDITYEASDDPLSKYRALAILNPTTELTAEYTCSVSSFQSDDFKKQKLIIYSPASEISLTYFSPYPNVAAVVCHASRLFPEPEIYLYKGELSSERTLIEGLSPTQEQDLKGFNVSIRYEFYIYELEPEEVFICLINLPGTDYSIQEEILYNRDALLSEAPMTLPSILSLSIAYLTTNVKSIWH